MLHLRPATSSDIPALRALAEMIWQQCYAHIISAGQIAYMLDWMYAEERIQRELAEGIEWELVQIADSLIGFLSYAQEPDGRVKLHKLYLIHEHQGHGHGRDLLAHVAEKARLQGASEVWLQVNKANKLAIAAYLRAGYAVASEAVFDIGQGYVMDDYLMACSL